MSKTNLVAILGVLGIVGASIISFIGQEDLLEDKIVNDVCVDAEGKKMVAAEELILREYKEGKVVNTAKICFKEDVDYKIFKDGKIKEYEDKTPEERAKWVLTGEGRVIGDILTHETGKLPDGLIQFQLEAEDDIVLKYIEAITSNQ